MKRSNLWLTTLVVLTLVASAACSNDGLDDGTSADVVLQVESLQTTSVSAQPQQGTGTCTISFAPCTTNADCQIVGEACTGQSGCELSVSEWTANFRNVPKNGVANNSSPFNDIVLQDVAITYTWQSPGPATPQRFIGLGGVIVPVGDTGNTRFFPISSVDVSDPSVEGNTADLVMVFRGHTVEGSSVSVTANGSLFVESCP